MEIGGSELTLNRGLTEQELAALVQGLKTLWPEAVLQNANETSLLSNDDPLTRLGPEFFVYSSRASFDSWEREGRSDQNAEQMVNVLRANDSTTLVVDQAGTDFGRRMSGLLADLDRKPKVEEPTNPKIQELVRKIGQLGFQVASMPYQAEDDPTIEYFMWVLNVPLDRLCEVQDRAIGYALDIYEDAALPVIIGVASPGKTRQLFEAHSAA